MKIFKLLKRWCNMILGKSSFHVEQGPGKYYSKNDIMGYYNDMTNKISDLIELDDEGIPINTTIANVKAYFPITIFQYGLGLYDLYLEENSDEFKYKFLNIANWTLKNQKANGMWECMAKLKDTVHKSQSSMCQSEGVSVLLRAYIITKENKYYNAATNAIDFMLKNIEDDGTCLYRGNDIIFQEYVSKDNLSVLNGWIFSIFGLFDYTLVNNEKRYKDILENTINSMTKYLKKYDRKFWSNYDLKGTIASPAYHDLHIRQLELLYILFEKDEFKNMAHRWRKYQNNKIFKLFAMLIKLKQKIFNRRYYDINTSLEK